MAYTPELLELIKVVESTRQQRLGQVFPAMPLEEREKLLKAFHPDYITEGMSAIRVGRCKGERTAAGACPGDRGAPAHRLGVRFEPSRDRDGRPGGRRRRGRRQRGLAGPGERGAGDRGHQAALWRCQYDDGPGGHPGSRPARGFAGDPLPGRDRRGPFHQLP